MISTSHSALMSPQPPWLVFQLHRPSPVSFHAFSLKGSLPVIINIINGDEAHLDCEAASGLNCPAAGAPSLSRQRPGDSPDQKKT